MLSFQIVVLVVLCLLTFNLVRNLRALSRPLKEPCPFPSPAPFVSVLVPARNEEASIRRCVESLQAQDYPNLEIIVYDDGSTDATGEIVGQLAEKDSRVRLLRGEGPPPGWAGKPNACFQLARVAKGDYLLFVDADTIHRPDMLKTAIPLAVASDIGLISGFPQQLVLSAAEKAAVPLIYEYLLSALPLTWPMPEHHPSRAFMIGQFLLFSREVYWRFGGHEAVKSRMMEDFQLGIEARKAGARRLSLNLSAVTCCHMYGSARSIWEGCRKWGYGFSSLWPRATILLEIAAAVLYLGPFLGLLMAVLEPGIDMALLGWSAAQVGVILLGGVVHDSEMKIPLGSVLLTPAGTLIVVGAFIAGSIAEGHGRATSWKGRSYNRTAGAG